MKEKDRFYLKKNVDATYTFKRNKVSIWYIFITALLQI